MEKDFLSSKKYSHLILLPNFQFFIFYFFLNFFFFLEKEETTLPFCERARPKTRETIWKPLHYNRASKLFLLYLDYFTGKQTHTHTHTKWILTHLLMGQEALFPRPLWSSSSFGWPCHNSKGNEVPSDTWSWSSIFSKASPKPRLFFM